MRKCWLVIVTRRLRVAFPPELYLEWRIAWRETKRWASTLSRGRSLDDEAPTSPIRVGSGRLLHLIEADFDEPWRACPLWVGVRWSEKSFPRIKTELMAADTDEATAWVRSHTRGGLELSSDPENRLECRSSRHGVGTYVAAHRLKRFAGF